jgi:protoheme IX farnesyltransferase
MYVFVYGWAKRTTTYSTLIGAVPGALPAMAGYVAISGHVTIGAWLVFILVFIWQMPHFYAISLFRKEEYRSAGLPVLGVVKPFETVRRRIMVYMVAYLLVVAVMLATFTIEPAAGLLLTAGTAFWAYVVLKAPVDHRKWARSVFGISLLVALLFLLAAILHALLRTWLDTIK